VPIDKAGGPRFNRARLRLPVLALLLCLIVSSISLIFSAMGFKDRLDEFSKANNDNQGWIISQLDVDYRGLRLIVRSAMTPGSAEGVRVTDDEMRQIRQSFDIFYSRVSVIYSSFQELELEPEIRRLITDLLEARGVLATEIDQLQAPYEPGLAALIDHLDSLAPSIREVTTGVLQTFIEAATRAERSAQSLVVRFQFEALTLFALMVISSFLTVRLWTDLEWRRTMTERAAENVTKAYEASLSAVLVTDISGKVIQCNEAASRILHYSQQEILGSDINDVCTPRRFREQQDHLMAEFRRKGTHPMLNRGTVRTFAERASGEEFPADVSITGDYNMMDERIFIVYITDVSEQVAAEEKLKEARHEAEQLAAAKSMFLATMSHEMRTPLHGVIASLELLDVKTLSQDNHGLIKTARDCSERALLQINEILDLIRLGENREPESAFSPQELARSIVQELTPLAMERRNAIELSVSGFSAEKYLGAPSAFARAIYNLAGNAVKFTEAGTICVDLAFHPRPDGGTKLSIAVTDTGIGIAPEDQDRIFNEFETLESGGANVGTGLGLAIANMAIDRLGGELKLESERGKGSRFYFDIDLAPDMAADDDAIREPIALQVATGSRHRVLLVDDNQVNRTLMARMVERLGHDVETASDGREAVLMASITEYDLILMDVSMPVMNGLEATRAIRKAGASRASVILGVTALVSRDDPELRSCGMQEVLGKPMKLGDLEAAFSRHLVLRSSEDEGELDQEDPMEELSGLVGRDTAHALVKQCFEDARQALESLRDPALEASERARVIHSAVGSTGIVGLRSLSDVLSRSERAALDEEQSELAALAKEVEQEIASARGVFASALV